MTAAMPQPKELHAALMLVGEKLPGLMGAENWDSLPSAFRDAAERLGLGVDPKELQQAADDMMAVLAAHPAARGAVDARLAELNGFRQRIMQTIQQTITDENMANAYYLSLLHGVMGSAPDEIKVRTRGVTIPPGGVGGARTVKLRNLLVHTGKVAEFVAHSTIFTIHGSSHPNPILTALGVVLLANCVREALTVHIPEQDASVFWGLIQAQKQPGNQASAPEPDILALTNQERGQVKLGTLPPEAVTRSLHHLAYLHCVEQVAARPTHWRILEKYKIES